MKNKSSLTGMAAACLANVIFGFSFIFSKKALSVAHPLVILCTRFTVAFLVLSLLLVLRVIRVNIKGKPLLGLALLGLAQPFAYFILELYGVRMASSALSGILLSLVPVGVLIGSALFFRKKPSVRQAVCAVISLAGAAAISLLSADGVNNRPLGILFLLGAVAASVSFNLMSRKQAQIFTPVERTYFTFLLSTVGFHAVTLLVLRGDWLAEVQKAYTAPDFWLAIAYLSVVSSVVAFLCYNYATTHISVVRSSSFSNISTVVSVLAGIFLLGEPFSWQQILLCIPIIVGVWGVNLPQKEKISPKER